MQNSQKNEDFAKFDQFLKDYEVKKTKANKKILEEKAVIEQKQRELEEINQEIAKQEEMRETLLQKIKNYEKCHEFLQSVVDKYSDEYQDIPDLLQRYRNLESSIAKLQEQNQKHEMELQATKAENAKLEKETSNEILLISNEIAVLQKKIEAQEIRKKNLQVELEKNIKSNFSENIVVGQIFMAIDNLYGKCHEIDTFIKSLKNGKKADEEAGGNKENLVSEQRLKAKAKGEVQKDMFDLNVAQENLEYILNMMIDLKEILKKK